MTQSDQINADTRKTLDRFAQAWQDRDIDTVMECFTDDCVYSPSIVTSADSELVGKGSVRAGILKMFDYDADAKTHTQNLRIDNDFACWEWVYTCADSNIIYGCDFFTIRQGLIQKKDAYRKFTEQA